MIIVFLRVIYKIRDLDSMVVFIDDNKQDNNLNKIKLLIMKALFVD